MSVKRISRSVLVALAALVVVVAISGAFAGDPEHPYGSQGPERVELPGIGSVYIFKLHGHEYLCNPRGDLTHAESCPCKQVVEKPAVK